MTSIKESLPGVGSVVIWHSASTDPIRGWINMFGKVQTLDGELLPLHCFHSWESLREPMRMAVETPEESSDGMD